MRGWKCVPMISLCLALTACGFGAKNQQESATAARDVYHDMTGCTMEATVYCGWTAQETAFTLRCYYNPNGESTVAVQAPETVAGVKAISSGTELSVMYDEDCLPAGTLSDEEISPAVCLPRLMSALRDRWRLEENKESWVDVDCVRLAVDQSGLHDGRVVSTIWLRADDATPLRGEIAVDGEIILTAEFTDFAFYDTMEQQQPDA